MSNAEQEVFLWLDHSIIFIFIACAAITGPAAVDSAIWTLAPRHVRHRLDNFLTPELHHHGETDTFLAKPTEGLIVPSTTCMPEECAQSMCTDRPAGRNMNIISTRRLSLLHPLLTNRSDGFHRSSRCGRLGRQHRVAASCCQLFSSCR
nr:hypothetical protein CFP56_56927 [Quercus suber]